MADTTDFASALKRYAADVKQRFSLHVDFQHEDQLKGPVAQLLKEAGVALGLAVQSPTEVRTDIGGRPDMGITVRSLLAGYLELKAPGKGADPNRFRSPDKEQWEKFKNLPNLVYTDGNAWALYRSGTREGAILRLAGDVTSDGAAVVTDNDAARLLEMLRTFFGWQPITPRNPRALAEMLAPVCRLLRTDVLEALKNADSTLRSLATDWRKYLFPDADDNQFADAYAQTLTYALLLARLSGAGAMSIAQASQNIRGGHRLLAETLNLLGHPDAKEEIQTALDLLERIIGAVDTAALTRKGKDDPWLYFYEDFLAAYDPKMRNDRGVYYTPVQVVQCQVRLVAELLAAHFDADYSFADEKVITLDPAAGTGTYLLAAIDHALNQVEQAKGPGMRAAFATQAARNIHAFEILVGPYAVAHLRLTQKILGEGGQLPAEGVHVYLTDTLEWPEAHTPAFPTTYRQMGEEHKRAQKVKAETPVIVCLGNPPYDRQTISEAEGGAQKRKGGWIRFGAGDDPAGGKLNDFLQPLRDQKQGVHAKNLYNDYVYFWRWALWKVFEGERPHGGIVSFITASSYLRGPGFAGMRKVMRQVFDDLWIIDLEGDNLGARKTENVFAIETPVAIALGVRYGGARTETPALVHYTRIDGKQADKLAALADIHSLKDLAWRPCLPGWLDPFLPTSHSAYWQWPLLTELFPWQENGMQFKRSWPIGETTKVLNDRWKALMAATDRRTVFKESRDRIVGSSYPVLGTLGARLTPIAKLSADTPAPQAERVSYRSFDRQWALVDNRLGDFLRPDLQRAHSDRQIYMTSLLTDVLGEGPAAVVAAYLPDLHHFRNRGARDVIPLWRDAAATNPNITPGVLEKLSASCGRSLTAEDFFAYCYAVLATPAYVKRFWDELTIPGPRMPVTQDAALFEQAVTLGRRLIWLHTYGERFVPDRERAGRVPQGTARCQAGTPARPEDYPTEFSYDPGKQELHIGKGVFNHVRPEVWAFSVSGFQVVKSWLGYRMKERAGKKSSPLDDLRPDTWEFDGELLDLLWVLDATVNMLPDVTQAFEQVVAGALFTAADFPRSADLPLLNWQQANAEPDEDR